MSNKSLWERVTGGVDRVVGISQAVIGMLPGGRFAFGTQDVRGAPVRVFTNNPPRLRDLYLPYFDMHAEKKWLVFQDETLTYGEAKAVIEALGRELFHGFGLKPGTRIGIAMRNYPEFLLAFIAIQAAGFVAVPLNSLWGTEELHYAAKDSGISLIFADAERLRRCGPFLAELGLKTVLCRPGNDGGADVEELADASWEAVVKAGSTRPAAPPFSSDPEDEAMIMYTSGSTGFPKGVTHTQRSVGTIVRLCELGTYIDPAMAGGVFLLPVPLFHITGIAGIFLRSIATGSTVVLMYKWDAGKALDLIERESCTSFTGVPTMVRDIMEHPAFSKRRVRSMKSMAAAGAPVPPTQVAQLKEKAGNIDSAQAYGLTEVIGATTIAGADYEAHPKSCGKAIPIFVELKIKDPATGADLTQPDARGEVCIRSAMMMKGYHNLPEKTAEVFDSEGFFHSGDIGRIDKDGFLYIMDRIKDLIIRGGENIDCSEVERAIYTHPAVRECSVFALPDERLGEVVGAAVWVTEPGVTVEQIRAAAAKTLAKFKVPLARDIFIVTDELPKGGTGKIDKKGLRAKYGAVVKARSVKAKL